jgi:hypothetical protein
MNKETMPSFESNIVDIEDPKIGEDILDIQNEFISHDLNSLPKGTESLYEEANQEKSFEVLKAQEEIKKLDEKEVLKEKKEQFINKIISENDPIKKEQLKKDYEAMLISEASLESEKKESFEF